MAAPKVTAASRKKAIANLSSQLTMLSTAQRTEGDTTTFSDAGRDIATLRLDGDDVVLDFAPPARSAELDGVRAKHYTDAPTKGWLRYRQPAVTSPKPALEAKLGMILGQAAFQRRKG